MFRFFLLLLTCVSANLVWAENLTNKEMLISNYAKAQYQTQLDLLEKLVNINSGTPNLPGIYRVGKQVERELNNLGFDTHWVAEPAEFQRASTLIAERHGSSGRRVLLIGHLDTVFPEDSPFQRFEVRPNNSARGPGVIDDKGGIVVILGALKALQAAHALDNTSITVVLTGDEESSGKPTAISRKPLVELAKTIDVALDFEPTLSMETSTIARRGITSWAIEVKGSESHSATIFQPGVGAGAIFELSRILNTMRLQFEKEKFLSFNPGMVLAGNKVTYDDKNTQGTMSGKTNIVAKKALALGDVRFINAAQKNSFENNLEQIIKNHLPGTVSKVTFTDGMPAMQPTASNLKLLEKYSKVSADLGQGKIKPLDAGIRGAGDISFVSDIVPANLAGLGPMGLGTHSVLESIDLASLSPQTQRAALLIYRLTHE